MTPAERPILAFDLDGTLVDSTADLARALNLALVEHGFAAQPVEQVRTFIGEGASVLVQRALAHARPAPADPAALLPTVLAAFRRHYAEALVVDTVVFPGLLDVLRALAPRAQLAILTNKPGVFARPIVERLMPGLFFTVLGPDDVAAHKPSPVGLQRIAQDGGARIAAFVGDTPIDEQTARAGNVPFVGVAFGSGPHHLEAGLLSPVELAEVLERQLRVGSARRI